MLSGGPSNWRCQAVRQVIFKNASLSVSAGSRRTFISSLRRHAVAQEVEARETTKYTRNIGIIAHIDAGKTTTTERMLYYSGYTRRIGDVDDGSTVTDFLPAERARGITIQSAAITFHWPPLATDESVVKGGSKVALGSGSVPRSHTINLIDTPGHADFTFEVLRSLRILDGAVCILDGVAGVEAQTEKVWYQAQTYKIPKIIYVNKLDRDGAAFGKTVKEIASKLHTWPLVCQIPWYEHGKGAFCGVVDIVALRALKWAAGGDGKLITAMDLSQLESEEPKLAQETRRARIALVELLSEHDDLMVEKYLESNEDHMAISSSEILSSVRRCLLRGESNTVPVFAGASFRNIGVQPVIDAVTALLPNPDEASDPEIKAGSITGGLRQLIDGKLDLTTVEKPTKLKRRPAQKKSSSGAQVQNIEACALAFKVVNDPKRGLLVYVRVYQGSIHRNVVLFNTNLQTTERAPRLLRMYASDALEIDAIPAGQIGVIPGLKHARTGDTLICYTGINPKNGPPAPLNELQLRPIEVPPPVFFASIEPQSLSEEQSVAAALDVLLREDPSLQLSKDEDSGQTLLSGMGELHLEIARDRLIQDLKAKAIMGKIEIGFRETISANGGPQSALFDREIAGRHGKAGSAAFVQRLDHDAPGDAEAVDELALYRDGNLITVDFVETDGEDQSRSSEALLPPHLNPQIICQALQYGALAALARGPKHSFPMHSIHVTLTFDPAKDMFGADTTPAALSSAARLATQAALKQSVQASTTVLMEPVMNVIISVDEGSLGAVVHDLTASRGAHIISLDDADVIAATSGGRSSREDVPYIDLRRVYAPPDPFDAPSSTTDEQTASATRNAPRTITARVPLKEMVGYLKHLRSHTGGRGTFVMTVDRFERMGSQREKAVLKELRGI